ncbi:MAG: hypothetical protein JWO94_3932 [Verrucomicrobiaceae bacterium]|nr:hypothetical protein [Verrucomicrobiaceae bacterium]
MKQTYTISPETGRQALQRVTDVPNVQHVAVLDAMGLCLLHSGPEPVSTMLLTDWTVVARSAFAACDDLGVRCGAGRCQESLQTHDTGGTLMRIMPGGMLLVVQYGVKTPVGTLRMVAMEVAEALPVAVEIKPPAPRPRPLHAIQAFSLPGAPNDPFAGESWWTDKVATHAPAHLDHTTTVDV